MSEAAPERLVLVRSTINLPGLPADRIATVDPDDPYMQACLNRGHLVLLDPPRNADDEGQRPDDSAD